MKGLIQIIAWTIEIVTFVTALLIGRYLWRLGRRHAAKRDER